MFRNMKKFSEKARFLTIFEWLIYLFLYLAIQSDILICLFVSIHIEESAIIGRDIDLLLANSVYIFLGLLGLLCTNINHTGHIRHHSLALLWAQVVEYFIQVLLLLYIWNLVLIKNLSMRLSYELVLRFLRSRSFLRGGRLFDEGISRSSGVKGVASLVGAVNAFIIYVDCFRLFIVWVVSSEGGYVLYFLLHLPLDL